MSNQLVIAQVSKLAGMFDIPQSGDLVSVLKATAFKGQVSDAQMSALLIVANQYRLNPWTKEIYAFPDKNNGIVPVVGVDGWARIINENPQFDGMDFEITDSEATCTIYRKDRSHPIKVTEYLSECKRSTAPWQSHPKRMLRHKAMIQCARLAFGYVGIFEQDEAERIIESQQRVEIDITPQKEAQALPAYDQAAFDKNLPAWTKLIESGKQTASAVINKLLSSATLTEKQVATINSIKKADAAPALDAAMIERIKTLASDMAVTEDEVCEAVGVKAIADMTPDQANRAIEFLTNGE